MPSETEELDMLARAVAAGSEPAFDRLLELEREQLKTFARAAGGGQRRYRQDESDLVQKASTAAFEAIRDRNGSAFRGSTHAEWLVWMRRIVRNHVVIAYREDVEAIKRTVDREEPLDGHGSGLEGQAPDPLGQAALKEALAMLPELERTAILLMHFEGRTQMEAARMMECGRNKVAEILTNGLRKLKELL
jgi:RNA polymerase sigma-70 factor (ECF subfamily)